MRGDRQAPSDSAASERRKEQKELLGLHSSPASIMRPSSCGEDRIASHQRASSSDRASTLVGRHQFMTFSM